VKRFNIMKRGPLLFGLSALALAGACATPPKPPELIGYETLRRDPAVPEATKRAPDLVAASDKLGAKATEEWSSNDLDESRRDALQAQIRLKTALALLEQERAKNRLQALAADQAKATDELNQLTQELSALKVQADLRQKLVDARKTADEEKSKLSARVAADQQLMDVQDKLASARLALRTADTVEAKKYAAPDYSAAEDLVRKAEEEMKAGNLAGASASLEVAKDHAQKALATAKPQYEQASQTAENRLRDEALVREAQGLSGVDVRIDTQGPLRRLVIGLGNLFPKGQSTKPDASKLAVIDPVAALINKYPSYPIQVIGHTDNRGRVNELVALSNARAQAIYEALVAKGVDAKRLMVSGQGPNEPLVSNRTAADRARNNRVEIVFLYH